MERLDLASKNDLNEVKRALKNDVDKVNERISQLKTELFFAFLWIILMLLFAMIYIKIPNT